MEILLAWFGQEFGLGIVLLDAIFLLGGALIMRPCQTRRARLLTAGIPFGLFLLAQVLFFATERWGMRYIAIFLGSFSFCFTVGALAMGLWGLWHRREE